MPPTKRAHLSRTACAVSSFTGLRGDTRRCRCTFGCLATKYSNTTQKELGRRRHTVLQRRSPSKPSCLDPMHFEVKNQNGGNVSNVSTNHKPSSVAHPRVLPAMSCSCHQPPRSIAPERTQTLNRAPYHPRRGAECGSICLLAPIVAAESPPFASFYTSRFEVLHP